MLSTIQDIKNRYPSEGNNIEIPKLPIEPDATSQAELDRYLAEIERLQKDMQSRLNQPLANVRLLDAFSQLADVTVAPLRTTADLLAFIEQQQLTLDTEQAQHVRIAARRAEADTLTQRIQQFDVTTLPDDLRDLLTELISTPSDSRSEALGFEIRARIAHLEDHLKKASRDRETATIWLQKLSGFKSFDRQKLAEQLLLVAADIVPLTDLLRSQVQKAIDELDHLANTSSTGINPTPEERREADKLMDQLFSETGFEQRKLTEQLALVVIGAANLTQELRIQAQHAIDDLQQRRPNKKSTQDKQQEIASIVQDALSDLGYQVEAISHTLFVEGGNMYFRQPDWNENYYVRLRVRPSHQQINFNVVRIGNKEQPIDDLQTKHDKEMQQAWCGDSLHGYQRLRRVLKDRGLELNTVREISAEELPVQVIAANNVTKNLPYNSTQPVPQAKSTKKQVFNEN